MRCEKNNRLGFVKKNKYGTFMKVIEYRNCTDIDVMFLDEHKYITHTNWCAFEDGKVTNPYDVSVYGIGYVGQEYGSCYNTNGIPIKKYEVWRKMIQRVGVKNVNAPTYLDCSVSDEWLNYTSFSKWFDKNYYEIEGEQMCLDKDILIKGNKLYSPETCVFVPNRINVLFTKNDSTRGSFPIGVSLQKRNNKYISKCSILKNNKKARKHLGVFDTPEEAFNTYKQFKEKYIKQVADEYKDKIPKKLYDAMYTYEVEITD